MAKMEEDLLPIYLEEVENQGYNDFIRGISRNPYDEKEHPEAFHAWASGWEEASNAPAST